MPRSSFTASWWLPIVGLLLVLLLLVRWLLLLVRWLLLLLVLLGLALCARVHTVHAEKITIKRARFLPFQSQ
jgi:hypothetical protein